MMIVVIRASKGKRDRRQEKKETSSLREMREIETGKNIVWRSMCIIVLPQNRQDSKWLDLWVIPSVYVYLTIESDLAKSNELDCYYCSCPSYATLQKTVFVLFIYIYFFSLTLDCIFHTSKRVLSSPVPLTAVTFALYLSLSFIPQIDSCHVAETQ